jgi:hypothetical protein
MVGSANDINFTTNANAGSIGQITNLSAGTAAFENWSIGNSTHALTLVTTSIGYTGTYLTGGPVGELMALTTGPGSACPLSFGTHNVERMRLIDAGNFTINAPASGIALTVNGSGTTQGLEVNGGASQAVGGFDSSHANGAYIFTSNAGTANTFVGANNALTGGLTADSCVRAQNQLFLAVNGAGAIRPAVSIGTTGAVAIAAPSSGTALTVNTLATANDVTITCNINGQNLGQITNTSTGAAASAAWTIGNSTHALKFILTSTGYSGAFLTNGPAGESANIICGPVPITFGTNNTAAFFISTTQQLAGWGPTAAAQVDMTPDTGTFTITATGYTAAVTGTATWSRVGKLVTIAVPFLSGTSNATTLTLTGIPVAIQPATLGQSLLITSLVDNAVVLIGGFMSIPSASGTWTAHPANGVFTASGTKQIQANFTYLLN